MVQQFSSKPTRQGYGETHRVQVPMGKGTPSKCRAYYEISCACGRRIAWSHIYSSAEMADLLPVKPMWACHVCAAAKWRRETSAG